MIVKKCFGHFADISESWAHLWFAAQTGSDLASVTFAQIVQTATVEIELDSANDIIHGDHVHAPRQTSCHICTEMFWLIFIIAVTEGHDP